MKFLSLLLICISSAAMACPDISGEYECNIGRKFTKKSISQTSRGFLINTDGSEMEYLTDGTVQTIPNSDSFKDVAFKSYCEGNKFIIDMTATITEGETVLGKQISKKIFELEKEDIHITHKTKMKGIPLPTKKEFCMRQ